MLAKTAIDGLAGGRHPDEAAQHAIKSLVDRVEGEAGCILVDRLGRVSWAYNSQHMAVAYMTPELSEPAIVLGKD